MTEALADLIRALTPIAVAAAVIGCIYLMGRLF